MATITIIDGTNIVKDGRAVINANFAALNAAKVEGATNLTTAGRMVVVSAAGVVTERPTTMDASGNLTFPNSVGVSLKTVAGTGVMALYRDAGDDVVIRNSAASGSIAFMTEASPTTKMWVRANGNVLIGTSSDNGQKLQVGGTIAAVVAGSGMVGLFQNTETTGFATVGVQQDLSSGVVRTIVGATSTGPNGYMGTESNHSLAIRTNNLDRMVVDGAGGVAFYGQNLALNSNQEIVYNDATRYFVRATLAGGVNNGNYGLYYDKSAEAVEVWTASSRRLRVTGAGIVIVNGDTPRGEVLDVYGTGYFSDSNAPTGVRAGGRAAGYSFIAGTGAYPLTFWANSARHMDLTAGGNLLLGATYDNGAKLQVVGQVAAEGANGGAFYAGSGASQYILSTSLTGGTNNGNYGLYLDKASEALELWTASIRRARFFGTGAVQFAGVIEAAAGGFKFPDGQVQSVAMTTARRYRTLGLAIDGGGQAITSGSKGYIYIPFDCTLEQWTVLGDAAGSIVVDVKRSTYAGFPATTSIVGGGNKPTLSNAQKSQASPSGWTATSLSAGDVIEFTVDSAATLTRASIALRATV